MEKKLHIKGIAGSNLKIDAMWYHYGEAFDCYMTPQRFKDCVAGFLDYDIILDENNSQPSINIDDYTVKEGDVEDGKLQDDKSVTVKPVSKGTKKASVQRK